MKRLASVGTVFFFMVFFTALGAAAAETYSESIAHALTNVQAVSGTNAFIPDLTAVPARGNKAIITIDGNPSSPASIAFGLKYQNYSGTNYLITRTVTNAGYYMYSDGSLHYGTGPYTTYNDAANHQASWVTTGNDATNFIDSNVTSAADVLTTMERGLGMSGAGTHTAIVEYGVLPDNDHLLRPTNLLDITTYSTDNTKYTYHSSFTPVDPGSALFSQAQTYLKYWQGLALDGGTFPWTELGYTYYWGHSTTDLDAIQGLSEFIILGGQSVKIIGMYSPQSYYYTKNKGGVFSSDADAEYGNGFASFNVTGNCDTIWAGNAFQVNASTDTSSPNQIIIANGAKVSGGQGILVWSTNYTVTNNGTISGATDNKLKDAHTNPAKPGMSSTANVALLFLGNTSYGDPGGKNILINSGSISSDATGAGTAVEADAGNTEITNSGTISGNTYAIYLASGTNTITNSAGGTITGPIEIVAGATTVKNYGTIDIGTAASDGGAYTQYSGATLKLTANSSTSFGKLTTTSATINATSEVHVTVGGYLANGTKLTAIDVGGAAVTAPGTISSSSYAVGFTADGTADLILTAARVTNAYATASSSGNTDTVGATLDQIASGGPTGDMLTVLNTLDQMDSATQVTNAIETMTPDVSSGAAESSRALTGQGFATVSNRLGGARSGGTTGSGISSGDMTEGVGVWTQGLGSHMKQDERKGIEGFSADTFGTTIGADKVVDNHFRVGLAGGYGWAGVYSKQPGSPSDNINSFQGIIYGSYDSLDLCKARQGGKKSPEAVRNQVENSWYVDGMFAFTQDNYDSRREIWLGTAKRVAKAEHYGQQYSTNFETGYKLVFEKTKKLEVTPFASLGYNYLYMNKYKEKGAGALNLNVQGEGFNQLEQGLGTKLAYPITVKKAGTFIPSAKAAWLYDYIGDRFETTASFAGSGPSFNTQGAKPARNGMLFGAELAFLNKGNVTITGNWDIELKDQFMSNTYYGTVRYDF